MKKHLIIILLLLPLMPKAQHFSYVSDRTFQASSDLLGYTFIPAFLVYPDEYDEDKSEEVPIGIGEFTFSVSANYLYIEGADIEGVYSISSINPTDYGYIIATMNARNPTIQGHLKVILNNVNQTSGLIFKMSNDTDEMVFKLGKISEDINQTEQNYFTNIDNSPITTDIIWNKVFKPFFRVGEKQQRLRIEDSVKIEVSRDTILIKKKKREKVKVERFITISYKGYDDNGNRTNYEQRYTIKRMKERLNRDPKATSDKFLIEIEVKGLPEKYIYFYLNEKRAVSLIELGANKFIIRGY